jgi:hypothetical protein
MSEISKNKKFGFDIPVFSDWAFYVFLLFSFANVSGAAQTYSGGTGLSNAGAIAFAIDAGIALAFAYFETWLIILLPRKFIRKSRNKA